MSMGALISLRFSVLVQLQAVFTANTPICGHIFIQFIIRPSALPLSLSLSPSRLVCLYPFLPPLSLLLPSSLPYCPNSLHKISHLLTQFTEINFPPNPKSHSGVCMCIGLWGEDVDLSFSGRIYVSSLSVHNDTWHSRENIHNACQSNPF